jgi:hypothetical protein
VWFNTSTDTFYTTVGKLTSTNITGLSSDTFYTVTVVPSDEFGYNGTNYSITVSTTSTLAPGSNDCDLSNSSCSVSLDFLQRPYIINSWLTILFNDIKTKKWQNGTTPNINTSCSTGILFCSSASDNSDTTGAEVQNTGTTVYIHMNFSINNISSPAYLNTKIGLMSPNDNTISSCYVTPTGQWINFFERSGTDDTGSCVRWNDTTQIPNNCLQGTNILQIRHQMKRAASSSLNSCNVFYKNDLFSELNYSVSIDGNLLFSSNNDTPRTESYNITDLIRATSSDSVSVITLTSLYNLSAEMNASSDLIYNKTINITIRDDTTLNVVNPGCTYNSGNIFPASQLISYVSSLDNLLNCSLTGYAPLNYQVVPLEDEYNLTIGGVNVNITLYDEQTGLKIENTSLFVNVIRESYAVNFSTTNGTIELGYINVPDGDIEIRYGGDGYVTRSYYITELPSSQLELYTIQTQNASLIVFSITDEKGLPVSGAFLKAKRYFIAENSYKLVTMEKTDTNGVAGLYLEPFTVPYIFIVELDGVVLFTNSNTGTKIFNSDVALRVNRYADVLDSYFYLNKLLHSRLTFDNSTKIFSYTWNDPSNIVVIGCLKVEKISLAAKTVLDETCSATASGTINFDITPYYVNETTFRATGYIETNTAFSPYPPSIMDIITLRPLFETVGKVGLFFSWVLILTAFFVGLNLNFGVAVIYTSLSMIVVNIIGVGVFGWAMIIGITVLGLAFAGMNRR